MPMYFPPLKEDNLSIKDKVAGPNMSIIKRFHCKPILHTHLHQPAGTFILGCSVLVLDIRSKPHHVVVDTCVHVTESNTHWQLYDRNTSSALIWRLHGLRSSTICQCCRELSQSSYDVIVTVVVSWCTSPYSDVFSHLSSIVQYHRH